MSSGAYLDKDRINYNTAKEFKIFKEKNPQFGNITAREYSNIIKYSNKLIAQAVLDNENGFKLPEGLGYIGIDKYKPRTGSKEPIDWINSVKFKKKILLTNFHSFGWIYRIRLYKNPHIPLLECYVFKKHRLFKRALAARIKAGQDYEPLDRSFFSRRFSIDKIFKIKS